MFENMSPLTGLVCGTIIGALLTVTLSFPRVARAIGKIFAVGLMGCGAGLCTWGMMSSLSQGEFTTLQVGPVTFVTAAQTLGWGVGSLVAGITALVLSFVGSSASN